MIRVLLLISVICIPAQASDKIIIRPTIPGTSVPDYRQPAWVGEKRGKGSAVIVRPAIKGTEVPDHRRKGYKVRRDKDGG